MDREEHFKNALKRYVSRLPFCASSLQRQISELEAVAAGLDKTQKGARIASITGGTTGAVGGAAVVAGILLAPATMGASLAVAALEAVAAGLDKTYWIARIVGATVVVAVVAGILLAPLTMGVSLVVALVLVWVGVAVKVKGVSAPIIKPNQVQKKVESILKEYQSEMSGIEVYLNDINSEMEKLKGVRVKSAETVRLVEIAGGTSGALSVMNRSSGVIQGFALGMDFFFTDKNSQKLKKEAKSRFAQQICEVAGQIQAGLTELMDMRDKLLSEGI